MKSCKIYLNSGFNKEIVFDLLTELEQVGVIHDDLTFTYEDNQEAIIKEIMDRYSSKL